jgi:hypothetical protein
MIDYFQLSTKIWDNPGAHDEAKAGTEDYCITEFGKIGLDIYYRALDLTYIGFVFCQLFMQNMFRSIYTGYTKQQMYFYTVENFLDICIFIVWLNFIIITYRFNLEGTWFISLSDCEEAEIFVDGFLNSGVSEEAALIFVGVILWVRVAYTLRLMPLVGPIIMLFIHSIRYLFGFVILFVATVMLIALSGTLLFKDLANFDHVDDSLSTIFDNVWGAFNFEDAVGGRFGDWVGYTYMVVIVIMLILVLTNFLIAIFASIYHEFLSNEKSIMMQEALFLRPVMEANDDHSSLI